MARPQVTVKNSAAPLSAAAPTATGTLFLLYDANTGPRSPESFTSPDAATDAGVPDSVVAWIKVALDQGVPEVYAMRAQRGSSEESGSEPDWEGALERLEPSFGPGQVIIPGVSTSEAHTALLAHAAGNLQRTVFLDVADDASASSVASTAAALAQEDGAERAGLFAPWVQMPGTGGAQNVPASVIAAGLVARGDAAIGHANQAPIGDQVGRGAGTVVGALGLVESFRDNEKDDIYDAGANFFEEVRGLVRLGGWKSLSSNPTWRQLNVGRIAMEVTAQAQSRMDQYIGMPIDGRGLLFAEVTGNLTGYLIGLYNARALYGATPEEAFTVVCDSSNNTPETISKGELHADIALTAATHVEQIAISIVTSIAG